MAILGFASMLISSAAVILLKTPYISQSTAGFILSFALTASNTLLSLLQVFSDLDRSMVAVERMNDVCNIDPESTGTEEITTPGVHWPESGSIRIRDLSVSYGESSPDVLRQLNLDIQAGDRLAICGKTGSGKSTLAASLFRSLASRGTVEIDSLDIAKVSLKMLRSRLTAIPQEPSLLSGTLRETLNMSGQADDYDMYEALNRVGFIKGAGGSMDRTPNEGYISLDSIVNKQGSNFSHGERQLLVLARALLKKSKIIVMDEATSNVDHEADERITQGLKSALSSGTTIITIAHRLRTVIDYDRVIVLDDGRIAESGPPLELLNDVTSAFHTLCKADGPLEFEYLRNAASKTKNLDIDATETVQADGLEMHAP